ncbi:MAG TPA: hypothetical protein VKA63_06810 [Candidatus Krumholzibacteria bacterium]|nr:hypothetical protein [Candidatus Krumholzibacteria bacterium]
MTDSASLYPLHFGEVLNVLPEYEEYRDAESSYRGEAPFRMAVGRHVKDWGERLLDLSEFQGNLLPRRDLRVVDHMVSTVTDIFSTLNCGGQIRRVPVDSSTQDELRACDTRILRLLEEESELLDGMHRAEWAGEWLEHDAREFYRKLRSLKRELLDRNLLLGLRGSARRDRRQPGIELI